jgi:Cytochrome P460
MVKDSKHYAASGGWGFGRLVGSVRVDAVQRETCFPCHDGHVRKHDWVFTRYAP